jgi:hypothetical protein
MEVGGIGVHRLPLGCGELRSSSFAAASDANVSIEDNSMV